MEQDNSDNNNTKEEDLELNDKPKAESVRPNSKLSELTNIIRRKPVIALTFISITIMVVSYFLSESSKTKESITFTENRESREAISGVEQAVDLRAKWTEEILNEVKTLKDRLESVIESRYLETTAQINNFNQKLEILENQPKQSYIIMIVMNLVLILISIFQIHHMITKQSKLLYNHLSILGELNLSKKKMLRTMLLAVVLLELCYLLESL
ncbi:putative conjugative transfer protein TraB [Orientia tsutsugamushi str. TA763]|nr:putative conjugative transfer protein TraB [Orientia tsutsugamushi str. TA763]